MKSLAALLAAFALAPAFAVPSAAQTVPPSSATSAPRPWRPVIIVDPRPYLATPTPRPGHKHHASPRPRATPAHRRPLAGPTPETFERLDTSPPPKPPSS